MSQYFYRANLRGLSFKGQNLVDANFSEADIRGANFANANLTGANFSSSKAGLQHRWKFGLVIGSLVVALISGYISAYTAVLIITSLDNSPEDILFSRLIPLIILIVFFLITLFKGFGATLGAFSAGVAATVVIAAAIVDTGSNAEEAIAIILVKAIAITGAGASVVLGSAALAVGMTVAQTVAVISIGIIAMTGIIAGVAEGVGSSSKTIIVDWALSIIVVVCLAGLAAYIGSQAVTGDKRYSLIQKLTVSISTKGGTNFKGANLTDANFSQAILKAVDFRKAILTRTCWFQSRQLNQARKEGTYLENSNICQLLVTGEGEGQDFSSLDLRGVNLERANLKDASLIGSNLSESTLQKANLAGSKLAQTQLYKVDLSGACLTGAYIQNWGISTDTQLQSVQCDYIYMQLPSQEDPDPCRKPDNKKEIFQEDDFSDFIAPIIKTLNLYQSQNIDMREVASHFKTLDLFHHEGIDPSAAAIALKQLAENNPEAGLEVLALEGRGHEKVRLQTRVSGDVDRSKLNAEYFATYSRIKALPHRDVQSILVGIEEKDERIRSLEKLLENALGQPRFYVETYTGDYIMSQSKGNINISGVQGSVSGVAAAGENQTMTGVALGAISGSVTNTINQIPESSDPDQPSLKELLIQLQAVIESELELTEEDKVEALEQVKTLAEAGQNPEDGGLKKAAKTAIKVLKGTVSGLPEVTKLVVECAKLLPAISALLILI